MKNITVSLSDQLYRESRIAAAEADTTVTAMVREFLTLLAEQPGTATKNSVLEVVEKIRRRHPSFQTKNLLTREELHSR